LTKHLTAKKKRGHFQA